MAVVFNLTPAQLCEARRMDYAVSFARTVAGVHYPSDNIAGLNMGQDVVADKLPQHLRNEYSANLANARLKVNRHRFDWAKFDPKTCQIRR